MKTIAIIRKINWKNINIPSNHRLEKKIVVALFVLIVFLMVSYGYFVKQTVINVVSREKTNEKISDLGSQVSNLEVEYINIKNKINLNFAYSLGYQEIDEAKFVSRKILGKTLTIKE